ncbi:MAG: hypothetical protein QW334_03300, partial [Thermofilum sp.]
VESGVEIGVGGLTLVESNVPESIVRLKYNDPVKYRLVPKIIDAGEVLELVCETLDGNLARKYEKEGYKVENTRVSAGSPIRFSIRMLQASVEKNELGMLGKQNTLRVAIANPTQDTLAYWVVLEAENEATVVETPLESWAQGPEAVKRIVSTPVAEPGSWLLPVPPGGAPYSLGFTAWVRRVLEGEYCNYVENSAYWPAGSLDCSFTVKILRNGRLVAKQRILESFESFDVGRTIARHPFETLTGFLTGFTTVAAITALSLSLPPVTIGLAGLSLTLSPFALVGIAASTASALMIYAQTGSSLEALTVSPLGIILAPVRALTDPTMDDSRRTSIIGAVIGAPLGAFVGQKIALDVVMLRMPSELRSDPQVYSKLYTIEEKHGTVIASTIARSIGKLYPHMNVPDAKGLVNMILGDALASRQDAVYIASMLEWASRMGEDFLRQHAGSMMEWLGSPLLRFKLNPLLQLSPDEALLLSKKVGGDFQNMLRLAEFKLSWEQLSKLGPDTVRVLSFGSEGVEVGVEKNLASQLYPGIQKGTIVEFEFAKGSIVLKGLLTYAEERALGDTKYLVFTFKAEERIPYVFELLKEDLQAIPGKQVEKTFGFNTFSLSNGKLNLDKGTLSMDGSVRLSDGMILRLDDPSIRLMPSQDALDTGVINRIVFQGRISGTSIVVNEDGFVEAFHGGTYLPAVVTASPLGLQLGLLAMPSGETLTISQIDLALRGITDLGFLNVVYPNGETFATIYTGGNLQVPVLSYSSGTFVGIQAVETRIVWTGIKQEDFYKQVAGTSEIVASVLGKQFAEELVKELLLNGLADTQVLDIVNGLVKNTEWFKTLSGKERIDKVKKIIDYVKNGETADEAVEKARKESEEYAKKIMEEAAVFCSLLSDPQLENEILNFIRHIIDNLGPDAGNWVLAFLELIYLDNKNENVARTMIRKAVHEWFKYTESKAHGCAIASLIIEDLMKMKTEEALELLNVVSEGMIINLSDAEILEAIESPANQGYLAERKVAEAIELIGEILGKRIKKVWRNALVKIEIGEVIGKLDMVLEAEDGKLIVGEVKSTLYPEKTLGRLDEAIESLEKYFWSISKYGITIGSRKLLVSDIEAYIAVVGTF